MFASQILRLSGVLSIVIAGLITCSLLVGAAQRHDVIAYQSHEGGGVRLYLVDIATGIRHPLTSGETVDRYPAWSPDGAHLAYVSFTGADEMATIQRLDANGRNRQMLIDARAGYLVWSPDGTQIALASQVGYGLVNADGSNPRDLTRLPQWRTLRGLSPNGDRELTSTSPDGDAEIFQVSLDGSTIYQMTHNDAEDFSPVWSPDGQSILFVSEVDGNLELYRMDADGRNQRNLTGHGARDEAPRWSPSGDHIAFISDRDGHFELYVMDADGANVRRLTREFYQSEGFVTFDWRP